MAATTQTETQTSTLLSTLRTQGFVVIPALFSPPTLNAFLSAAQSTTALARSGQWPHLRTLPKQFPPWPSDPSSGIWGVQHLLHPQMPSRSVFASCYFSDELLAPVKELLELPPTEHGDARLVMELFNLLVKPDSDFELKWHRDSVPFDISIAEEARLLDLLPPDAHDRTTRRRRRPFHAQYNIPLFPDASLHVVPGSHLRPRTDEEFRTLANDAYAPSLPGMLKVTLNPGDVVFYDNNIIHRGVYSVDAERLTLHGSVGDVAGGSARARNVLQHAVGAWIDDCRFDGLPDRVRARAEGMRERLVKLGRDAGEEGTRALHED